MELHHSSTETLEGVGPATADKLTEAGVNTLADLLLQTPYEIADASDLNIERIEAWRSAALFLELPSMNAQFAEALLHEDIKEMEMLEDISDADLEQVFAKALEDNLIAEVPDAITRANMRMEAVRHRFGAHVHARCNDENGDPVSGANVHLAEYSTTTNDQGYWRIHSLPLNESFTVFLQKAGFERQALQDLPSFRDPLVLDLPEVSMKTGIDSPIEYNEYLGDALPSLDSYRAKQVILGPEGLREHDLLKVSRHYSDGDIKLISLFMSTSDQQLNIHCFRLSGDVFNSIPPIGTYYKFEERKLFKVDMGEESVYIMKAIHKEQVRRVNAGENTLEHFEQAQVSINVL